ncbi:hypothetical protein TNCV_2374941 [Trichonephila clavipes]|nr:hypothetical protein TNCV_2374941 [Trichonephila clavipes]
MRYSSVKKTSFHSAAYILLSLHHWQRRRLWFCVKGRPINGRLADRPLCCKRRRMCPIFGSPIRRQAVDLGKNIYLNCQPASPHQRRACHRRLG